MTTKTTALTDDIVVNTGVLVNGALNPDEAAVAAFREWIPIGANQLYEGYPKYSGIFDGNKHTVSGLYGDYGDAGNVGFIGYMVSGGAVKNLGIVDSYFCTTDESGLGALVGKNQGTVEGCYSTATVKGWNSVGGIAGVNQSTIKNCYNIGNVTGDYGVGGIVGVSLNGTVKNCYNVGSVTGKSSVGDVIGMYANNTVTNNYYLADSETDSLDGTTVKDEAAFASGEIAYALNGDQTTIVFKQTLGEGGDASPNFTGKTVYYGRIDCLTEDEGYTNNKQTSDGKAHTWVHGECRFCGAVCDHTENENPDDHDCTTAYTCSLCGVVIAAAKENHNWTNLDGECANDGCDATCQHKGGTATCKEQATCTICGAKYGDLADHNWVNGACTYNCGVEHTPHTYVNEICSGCGKHCTHEANTNGFCNDCGGFEEPAVVNGVYQIANAGQLYWFADKVNNDSENFGSADAVLTTNIVVNDNVLNNDGMLNGDGSNFRAWTPIGYYAGTFDGNGKTISGLYFDNGDSNAYNVGLFGQTKSATETEDGGLVQNVGIVDSYFRGNDHVGALVGVSYGTVQNCYNSGTVSGDQNVGGVVGNNSGTVDNCHNTGSVSGDQYVGGVVGHNSHKGETTKNSYNSGSVNGRVYVGGVAGNNQSTIENCYNTGDVTGSGNQVGGVAGCNNGTVDNCYNTGAVTGSGNYVGGVVGYNEAVNNTKGTTQNSYNTGTVSGGQYYIGGVVGSNYRGTIQNCYNTNAVSGGQSHVGGVVGYNNEGTTQSCYSIGTVTSTGDYVGGVVGCNYGTITGCYYDNTKYTGDAVNNGNGSVTNVEGKTSAQFASGEVAYLLQGQQTTHIWGQKLTDTKDAYPVLGGAKVVCGGTTFVNGEADNHNFVNDKCENCGLEHTHNWSYALTTTNTTDATITATCASCEANSGQNYVVTITLSAPTNLIYSGTAKTATVTVDPVGAIEAPEISYSRTELINAGSVTASIKLGEVTASVTYAIAKAAITPAVSLDGWTYGEAAKTPVVTDNPGNGTITYTYSADGTTYTETVPTNAGTYTVKATVAESGNYQSGEATAEFTIAKATPTATVTPATGLTYTGSAQNLVTGTTTGGTLEYSLNEIDWSATVPTGTNADTYTVYYKVVGNENYSDVPERHIEVTIAKKPVTADMVSVTNNQTVVVGIGDFTAPVVSSEVTGILTYSYNGGEYVDYAAVEAMLRNLAVGNYSLTWKLTGSNNYSGEVTGTINFSVVDILFTVGDAAATVNNAVTIKTNPTYGDSWDQIITINSNLKAAVGSAEDTEDSHFTLSVSGNPDAGEQSFSVLYTGTLGDKTFTNQEVCSGTVTVQPEKLSATKPVVTAKTYNSITVNTVAGQKYLCLPATDAAPTIENKRWQESGSFTGLIRDTAYVIYTYKPATDANHAASDVENTAVTTEMEQITTVTAPGNVTLTDYYTSGEEVKAALASTTAVTTEGGTLSSLTITWTAPQSYKIAPDAKNTFSWAVTAPAGYKFAEGVITSGTITVTNKAATAVVNVGTPATITYSGTTYDVAQMFTKDANAGAASYSIVAGGTGAGTLDGSKLTITKAGTIQIKMTTAANGNYAAGEATATLTVNKAATAAPATGEGYTIDYEKETITVASGYQISTQNDDTGTAVPSGSIADYLGQTLYIRKAGDQNHADSNWVSFTVAARPAAPNLTVTNETLKGQKNGSITDFDTTMAYSTDGGDHWIPVDSSTKFENLEAGKTVLFRVKATATAPHGETVTCTIAAGNPITVTFAAQGNASFESLPAALTEQSYGAKVAKPADPTPTNEDFIFVGWYKDAAGSTAWDFDTDTLTQENVTVYAKWKQVYFSVGAEIKDHNGAIYQGSVTVKLMRGDSQIDSVTGTEGSFTFSKHVEAGMYNLVAVYTDSNVEHTKTELINVDHDDAFTLLLPAPGVNSHLNVSSNAQTPDVMVGGLDKEAAAQKGSNATVTIDMSVEGKPESQVPSNVVTAVETETKNNATIEYLDITITKQVDGGAKTEMSETRNILEIVVPYDITGKTELRVFRYHNGIQRFTEGQNTDRTFYYANGYIHIFTNKFSNYMIAYEVAHTITLDANGGTVTGTPLQTKGDGTLETLPTPTRDGYVFKGWYTANTGGTKVTTATVFADDASIYAQWGGYSITVKDSANGTVKTNVTEAPKGTAVTMTVTPKYGYYLKTMVVKDEAGKTVTVGTDNKGTYGFLMPASNVTVTATFSKISTSNADPTNPKTGDTFQMTMWLNMMAISAIAATTLLTWNKKKKR